MIKFYSGIKVTFKDEDFSKIGVVYLITFSDGVQYIGQTKMKVCRRINQHCECNRNRGKISQKIKEMKSFTVDVLESGLTDDNVRFSFESLYIKLFDTTNNTTGLNIEIGNSKISDETRSKQVKSRMKRVTVIETGEIFENSILCGKKYGVSRKYISDCVIKGKTKRGITAGLTFKYLDKNGNLIDRCDFKKNPLMNEGIKP